MQRNVTVPGASFGNPVSLAGSLSIKGISPSKAAGKFEPQPSFADALQTEMAGHSQEEETKPAATEDQAKNAIPVPAALATKLGQGLVQPGIQNPEKAPATTVTKPNLPAKPAASIPVLKDETPAPSEHQTSKESQSNAGKQVQKSVPQEKEPPLPRQIDDSVTLSLVAEQAGQSLPPASPAQEVATPAKTEPGNAKSNVGIDEPIPANTNSSPITGDLAFATKISSNVLSTSQPVPVTPVASTAAHSLIAPSTVLATQAKQEPGVVQPLGEASIGTEARSTPQETGPSETKETNPTFASSFEAELKAQAEPVRSAHVQITGSDNQRVDIRLLERGGALSVSVRSGDSNLTKALQEHAPELSRQLSADRFKADIWTPNSQKQSQDRNGSGEQPRERRNDGGSNGEQAKKDQRQNPQQDPSWVTAFETTPSAFQKRINYTWQQ